MSKKTLYIIGGVLFFIFEIFLYVTFHDGKRIVSMLLVLFVVCFIYAMFKLFRKNLNTEVPSSYFQDLGKRNLDSIVLGSSNIWKFITYDEHKIYNCSTYKKSLFMDFCYLKTFFSHVKTNGTVFIVVDFSENIKLRDKVSIMDIKCIHPHIFFQLNLDGILKKRKPILLYDIVYAAGYLFHIFSGKRTKKWIGLRYGKSIVNSENLEYIYGLLNEMIEFCRERSLKPQICFIHSGKNNRLANEELMKRLENVEKSLISNPETLRTIFLSPIIE